MSTEEIKFEKNGFDLVRYWAVFSIVLLHYTGYALNLSETGLVPLQIIRNIISFFPGVVIFFSMSGFLVSASLERSGNKKEFLVKRVFRMYPELWVCTLVNLAVVFLLARQYLDKSIVVWLGTQVFGVANTPSCLKDWATGSINGALWTIFVQIQLYVVLAFSYKWLKRRSIKQWIGILSAAAFINVLLGYLVGDSKNTIGEIVRRVFVGYAIWFLIGVFAYIYRNQLIHLLKKAIIPLFLIYFAISCLPFQIPGYYANIAIGILCPIIVIGGGYCLPSVRIKTDITYGMFLYHWIILNVIVHFDLMSKLPWIVCLILYMCLTSVSAWLSSRYVGIPSKKTTQRLLNMLEFRGNNKNKMEG